MFMYTGIVRQNVIADGSGRWNLYIGQERGNARIEVRQMNSAQDHIYGWASAWATVKVHVHGVFIRDVQADGSRKMGNTFRI